MTPGRAFRPFVALAAFLLPASLGALPTVLSPPFRISTPFVPASAGETRRPFEPAATARASGDFVVQWAFQQGFAADVTANGLETRFVSPSGQPGGGFGVFNGRTDEPGCPALAATSADGYAQANLLLLDTNGVLDLTVSGSSGTWIQQNAGGAAAIGETDGCPGLAANAAGAAVLAWAKTTDLPPATTYQLRAFGTAGEPLRSPFRLDAAAGFTEAPPAVGIDRDGRSVVVWRGTAKRGLYARRFAADGRPIGAAFLIAASYADGPVLSMAPEGDFAIAYTKPAPAGHPRALVLRRFAADGTSMGAPFSPGTVAGFDAAKASTDRSGNFALSWRQGGRTLARVFARSLAPRTATFAVGPAGASSVAVALADSGRLLAAWPAGTEVVAEIWQAIPAAPFCVARGQGILCADAAADPRGAGGSR